MEAQSHIYEIFSRNYRYEIFSHNSDIPIQNYEIRCLFLCSLVNAMCFRTCGLSFGHLRKSLASARLQQKHSTWPDTRESSSLWPWWHVPAAMWKDIIDLLYLMVKTSVRGGDRGQCQERENECISGQDRLRDRRGDSRGYQLSRRGLRVQHCNIVFTLLPYMPHRLCCCLDCACCKMTSVAD